MEDKITLDREAFRSLASKTRVDILKSLDKRRKMLTELSRQFGMSPSTIKEHMDNLSGAGLVVQIDDGHKWKYYELTPKGREIVRPTGSRIFIILGTSLFALVFTAYDLARAILIKPLDLASRGAAGSPEMMDAAKDAMTLGAPAVQGTSMAAQVPVFHILGIAVFTAIFGISLGYLIAKRMNPPIFD
jgi:DNA-binding transcriptional ArsR family regulator